MKTGCGFECQDGDERFGRAPSRPVDCLPCRWRVFGVCEHDIGIDEWLRRPPMFYSPQDPDDVAGLDQKWWSSAFKSGTENGAQWAQKIEST